MKKSVKIKNIFSKKMSFWRANVARISKNPEDPKLKCSKEFWNNNSWFLLNKKGKSIRIQIFELTDSIQVVVSESFHSLRSENIRWKSLIFHLSIRLFFKSSLEKRKLFIFEDLKSEFWQAQLFWALETNKCTQARTQERYLYR